LKRASLLFLTAVYFLAFSQPFLPFLQYALYKDFITSEWCVNREVAGSDCEGRCFLNSELSRSTDQHSSPESQSEVRSLAPHNHNASQVFPPQSVLYWVEAIAFVDYSPPFSGLITPPPRA